MIDQTVNQGMLNLYSILMCVFYFVVVYIFLSMTKESLDYAKSILQNGV